MTGSPFSLHWADYAMFGAVLVVSLGIGVYHACAGTKQRRTSEYLVGNRKMSVLPVSFSYVVTFISSIFVLGLPAEMYVYGFTYLFKLLSIVLANALIILIVVPLFHPLQLTSSYEYLEKRYDSVVVRKMGAVFGILLNTFYMGAVLYGPAVAMETVTKVPLWASVFLVGIVSITYTSIGGIKAVIWTDVFQFLIMLIGSFAIFIKSMIEVGGWWNFWKYNQEGGRLEINWSLDPTVRTTFWNCLFAGGIGWFGMAFNQSSVQRIAAMPTQKQATRMILLSTPGLFILSLTACLQGFAAFAYYTAKNCDPFAAGYISNSNEILPYLVMSLFQTLPGLSGIFMAALFSASLSTLSSGLNAIAANTLMDFVIPFWPKMSEFRRTVIAKILVLIFGLISIGISFMVMKVPGPITQICTSLLGSLGGPMTGIFLVGAFFPWANYKGALAGGLCGFSACMWITLGAQITGIKTLWLPPAGNGSCVTNGTASLIYGANSSAVADLVQTIKTPGTRVGLERLYSLSFTTYSLVGLTVCVLVSVLVSAVTGFSKPRDIHPLYLSPLIRRFFYTDDEITAAFSEKKNRKRTSKENGEEVGGNETELDNFIFKDKGAY